MLCCAVQVLPASLALQVLWALLAPLVAPPALLAPPVSISG